MTTHKNVQITSVKALQPSREAQITLSDSPFTWLTMKQDNFDSVENMIIIASHAQASGLLVSVEELAGQVTDIYLFAPGFHSGAIIKPEVETDSVRLTPGIEVKRIDPDVDRQ